MQPSEKAFKFTGDDAENYDKYLGPILFEPYGRYLASKIDATNISSVLEIACGTGRVTRQLRKALPASVKLVATDLSSDMLAIAEREIDNAGIEFRTEDAQNLSFAGNSFDLVICQFGMMFLPDKARGFSEVCRVLKPGGKFLCFTWDDTLNIPLYKLLVNELLLPHFADENDTSRFFTPFAMHDPSELETYMENAGFTAIKVKRVALRSGPHKKAGIIDAMLRKHRLGRELMEKNEHAFEPAIKKFDEEISKRFGGDEPTVDLSALLTTGVKP
ncbi:MAG: methyltransferase domain-containing protein [Bacteroidetes bacterium]|nr:methyltransferase domain-containing protein [Bacteroidota bacterium]